MRNIALLAVLALPLASQTALAVEMEPLFRAQLLGGQYFFKDEKASLSGNASMLFAPALRFNERWSLLPSFSSAYQGTKRVVDLVGAGSLFQEQMDHRAGLKAVYVPEDSLWRLKGRTGYKAQMLKETRDEHWMHGLFDYQSAEAGLEAEYVYRDPFSVRIAYDYAYTFFPNYTALESQHAWDFQGQPLAREMVGDRVLDSHLNMLSLAFDSSIGAASVVQIGLRLARQSYPRQAVVKESGLLDSARRSDYSSHLSAGLRTPFELRPETRLTLSGGLWGGNLLSDQNSYDASRLRFISRYYDYVQFGTDLGARLDLGDEREPISVSLGLSVQRRNYLGRPAQDSSGLYRADHLVQDSWMLTGSLRYPMSQRISLLFELEHGRTSSNQGYAQFYSYDYSATNYLFGLQYEY
ncbi:MAG: hypothetical protein WCU88_04615 [Elusimicrobiota bacterium]|jgi:hypothetical protein